MKMNLSHGDLDDNVYLECTKFATCFVQNKRRVHSQLFSRTPRHFCPKKGFSAQITSYIRYDDHHLSLVKNNSFSMANDHHGQKYQHNQDQNCWNIRRTFPRAPFSRRCQKGPGHMCSIILLIITMTGNSLASAAEIDFLLQSYSSKHFVTAIVTSSGALLRSVINLCSLIV